MSYIIGFLEDIIQTFAGVINFILTLYEGVKTLFEMLPSLIADMTSAVGFLPMVLTTFFGVSVTVTIIFLLVGRGQGGD